MATKKSSTPRKVSFIRKIKHRPRVAVSRSFSKSTEPYHPNSYYIRGGVDIMGDALALNGDVKFDDEESIAGTSPVTCAFCDPRRDFIGIVEEIGIEEALDAAEEAAAKLQSDDNTD